MSGQLTPKGTHWDGWEGTRCSEIRTTVELLRDRQWRVFPSKGGIHLNRSLGRFRKEVDDRLTVLRAALEDVSKGSGEAEASVRRIARSVGYAASRFSLDEIQRCAEHVDASPSPQELLARAQVFLETVEHAPVDQNPARKRILVIEDDPVVARLLESTLAEEGCDVLVAQTAEAAEGLIETQTFDLLLLDLILPDADGRDLLQWFRARPTSADIPVIVHSILTASQAVAECLALGAQDYLEKPVRPDLVRAIVRRHLEPVVGKEERGAPSAGVLPPASWAALALAFQAARGADTAAGKPLSLASIEPFEYTPPGEGQTEIAEPWVVQAAISEIGQVLRASDLLATGGGGRIFVLFPDTAPAEAAEALARARKPCASSGEDASADPGPSRSGFSAGVADVTGSATLPEAVARAERMLNLARGSGPVHIRAEDQDAPGPPARILLVEDDRVTAKVVMHRLAKEGMEVVHFEDGEAAHEAVLEGRFALAIFDVNLPGMSGFELLQRARELPHFRRTPVVMLTAMGRESDVGLGFELGANDYVMKPFSPVELVARIHRLLKD